MQELAAGQPALTAAERAFGDLDRLNREAWRVLGRKTLYATVIDASTLVTAPLSARRLRPGESEVMPLRLKLRLDPKADTQGVLTKAREIAGRYADDPVVAAVLADAEFAAGNDDAAIAAAERALALDAQQVRAHIRKGLALARKLERSTPETDSWRDVRAQFLAANKVENDHPVPLMELYSTYLKRGIEPTKNAIAGLEWALHLAPFDITLRWLVSQQLVRDERWQEAAVALGPLAYTAHPNKHTNAALELLKSVETKLKNPEPASTVGATVSTSTH